MRKFKRHSSWPRKFPRSMKKNHSLYILSSDTRILECYSIRNGFLIKNSTIIGLASSGIVETAVEGFLHVDEDEKYMT